MRTPSKMPQDVLAGVRVPDAAPDSPTLYYRKRQGIVAGDQTRIVAPRGGKEGA